MLTSNMNLDEVLKYGNIPEETLKLLLELLPDVAS